MIKNQRGFTLIELLVVIAIIAILAAILFPVFANARKTAKSTVTVSNWKNITTAGFLYTPDYDDTFMIQTAHGEGILWDGVGPNRYATWVLLLQPYLKNSEIFYDALGPNPVKVNGWTPLEAASIASTVGYNQINLAYWNGAQGAYPAKTWIPVSSSSVAEPSGTVYLASISNHSERTRYRGLDPQENFGIWGVSAPYNGPVLNNVAFPPYCDYDADKWYCFDWNLWGDIEGINRVELGKFTAGVSLRYNDLATIAFTDGSVKKLHPTKLAAGTNYRFKVPNEDYVVLTDKTKYLWDTE